MQPLAALALAFALASASGSALAQYDAPRDYRTAEPRDDNRHDPRYGDAQYDYAQVLSVDPILVRDDAGCGYDTTSNDDRPYRDEPYRDEPYRNEPYGDAPHGDDGYADGEGTTRASGAAIGAIIGGLLGHTVGEGDNRTAATVAGALIGGVIGAEVAERNVRRRAQAGNDPYRNDPNRNDPYRNDPYRNDPYRNEPVARDDTARCDDRDTVYRNGDPAVPGEVERVVGYEVTYRYDGRTYRTQTDHHPGDRIRIRVDVLPDGRRVAMGT